MRAKEQPEEGVRAYVRVCLGTVQGDMHDIGKNLVKIMMEGSGLEVIDLGVDVSPEDMVRTAQTQHCDIIACSALLTTTMDEMRRVVELANQAIALRLSIRQGGNNGSIVYQELHSVTTNQFGLFNVEIGGGTLVSGAFNVIDWGTVPMLPHPADKISDDDLKAAVQWFLALE